jgi:hypothetical protein
MHTEVVFCNKQINHRIWTRLILVLEIPVDNIYPIGCGKLKSQSDKGFPIFI